MQALQSYWKALLILAKCEEFVMMYWDEITRRKGKDVPKREK